MSFPEALPGRWLGDTPGAPWSCVRSTGYSLSDSPLSSGACVSLGGCWPDTRLRSGSQGSSLCPMAPQRPHLEMQLENGF